MAVTNIELYEELKKNLTEEAARMIAEVVPKAEDLATKADISELKTYIDSRLLRFVIAGFIPIWAAMFGILGVLIAKT